MTRIFSILLLISYFSNAQEIETIQTDRPDQTETPSVVPKKMIQIESGFSYQKNKTKNKTITLPSTLWKYGVNDNFEFRLISEFSIENDLTIKTSGLKPILIGCKIKISDEKGIFPKTAFIGHLSLPKVATIQYKTEYYAPEFRFAMQHTLSKKINLSYNLGSEWDGNTLEPTFIYTISTGYSISKKTATYFEVFGFAPQKENTNHNIDGGITYLINDNFMLDLSSGFGISKNAPKYYIAFGFSFRI